MLFKMHHAFGDGLNALKIGLRPRSFTLIHDSMIVWISGHDRHS
jgi:hypothetical protein